MTSPKHDPLSLALEELRNRPIVNESRDYARNGSRASSRRHRTRERRWRSIVALAAIGIAALLAFLVLTSNSSRQCLPNGHWPTAASRSKTAHESCWTRARSVRVALFRDGARRGAARWPGSPLRRGQEPGAALPRAHELRRSGCRGHELLMSPRGPSARR